LAVGVILIVAIPIYYERVVAPQATGTARLVGEALNDHLRILYSPHPLEIQSGEIHQVKPWFAGRLDFAPVVSFAGDQEYPLRGGAIGYFVDRKAAVFVYTRRLHTISLFVFRAEGFLWPARGLEQMGSVQVYRERASGFNVLLWRAGGLGYALVSDLNSQELFDLGAKVAGRS
jgi:anti-sigma factor RsiW